ncbi:hypothetical protein BH20ACT6_BH20ACT6_22120 [soil metagenome]
MSEPRPQLSAIIDAAPTSIYVKDLDGRYLFVSPGVVSQTGITAEQYLGHTDVDIFGAEQAARLRENDRRALTEQVDEIEIFGEPVDVVYRSHKFALHDADGQPYATCGISLDVTAGYRAEQAQRVAERRLAQLRIVDSLGRYAGGMAHDLKNALTAVRSLVELAIEDAALVPDQAPAGLKERLLEVLGEAQQATLHSAAQIATMLTATQYRRSERTPTPVAATLDRVRPLLHTVQPADRLVEDVPTGLSMLIAEGEIEQVLLNLVTNAAEATDDEVVVTIRVRAVAVEKERSASLSEEPPALDPGRYVCLDVVDDGPGMLPQVLERAVHPLFTTKRGGSGLGLWSAQAFVLRNRGQLAIRSEPGQGTTVSLWLPAADAR